MIFFSKFFIYGLEARIVAISNFLRGVNARTFLSLMLFPGLYKGHLFHTRLLFPIISFHVDLSRATSSASSLFHRLFYEILQEGSMTAALVSRRVLSITDALLLTGT